MFDAQIQKYYYDLHKADYELVSVHNNEFIPYKKETMNTDNLIIYDDAKSGLNDIGENKYALSKSWYKTRKYSTKQEEIDEYNQIRANLTNFFTNKVKAKSDDIIWTVFKGFEDDMGRKGYKKGFIPSNLRGTNEYINRHYVAYPINKFLNPTISNFFKDRGIEVDENAYALSEMVQF